MVRWQHCERPCRYSKWISWWNGKGTVQDYGNTSKGLRVVVVSSIPTLGQSIYLASTITIPKPHPHPSSYLKIDAVSPTGKIWYISNFKFPNLPCFGKRGLTRSPTTRTLVALCQLLKRFMMSDHPPDQTRQHFDGQVCFFTSNFGTSTTRKIETRQKHISLWKAQSCCTNSFSNFGWRTMFPD